MTFVLETAEISPLMAQMNEQRIFLNKGQMLGLALDLAPSDGSITSRTYSPVPGMPRAKYLPLAM